MGERPRVSVQSAQEIPELVAWWDGLEDAGVIVPFVRPIVKQAVARVPGALMPDSGEEGEPANPLQEIFQLRTQEELRRLEVAGLLEFTGGGHGRPVVPLALRVPVMIGVSSPSAVVEGEDG